MSDLHTVNKSPFEKNSLDTCLRLSKAGSSILLYEDGVYAALAGTSASDKITGALADRKVYVLEPDFRARGLKADRLIEGVEMVDYAGFVDLVDACSKVQAWV
ncbi:MAG TPA: sulfurtransferase complex subunit TusB [Chromatiales bacterium]|nr:sulfurtransferase complex subunit TusB [Chromatiales bacterium]